MVDVFVGVGVEVLLVVATEVVDGFIELGLTDELVGGVVLVEVNGLDDSVGMLELVVVVRVLVLAVGVLLSFFDACEGVDDCKGVDPTVVPFLVVVEVATHQYNKFIINACY